MSKEERNEGIAALLMYAAAFLYTYAVTDCLFLLPEDYKPAGRIVTAVFVLLFLLITELVHRGTPRLKEGRFWLACTLLTAGTLIAGRSSWEGYNVLFLHCFAVYYALVRSGKLMDRSSGAWVFFDGWHAFIGWPLRCFFRRVITARRFVLFKGEPEGAAQPKHSILLALPVLLAGGLLLALVIGFLEDADSEFAALISLLRPDLDLRKAGELLLRLAVSLPVGAYIFGLIDGGKQENREHLDRQKQEAERFLSGLGRLPENAWILVLAVFSLVYVVFFGIQGEYLFSALLGKLPEGFTASSYARQGFFELCKVMVVNFALLWLVQFTSDRRSGGSMPLKISLTALMAESALLAVTAMSKLVLYIDRFGFTAKRIEGSWLIAVLFSGAVLCLVHLWSGKKTFRLWLFVSCGLLALMQLM